MTQEIEEEIKAHIALGIILNEKGEVLIIQRIKEEKGAGEVTLNWAFPGGKIEEGEDSVSTSIREVLEETGYSVSISNEISGRKHPQFPVYVHYMAGVLLSSTQLDYDQSEIKEVKWVKPEQLKDYFSTDFDEKVQDSLGIH
ncbi:MAG TPA: NUDIX hydrolase [Candidatus Dojkabacteria bacterium]|nr:NUDIX hydrolase [Candidatus Dojkabacteria bacterium]